MSSHSIAWQYSLSFFEVFLPGLLMLICFACVTHPMCHATFIVSYSGWLVAFCKLFHLVAGVFLAVDGEEGSY